MLRQEQLNENTLFTEEEHDQMSFRAAVGGLLFGCGWGIAGLDLTTYFIHSAVFSIPVVVIFGLYLIIGTMIGDTISP